LLTANPPGRAARKKRNSAKFIPGKRREVCGEKSGGRKSGNLREPICAGTLREKECGDAPHFSRGAFLLREYISARKISRQILNAFAPE